MPAEMTGAVLALMFVMIIAISTQWRRARQSTLDLQLLQSGALATGKVLAINRPFGLPHEAHVYFSYTLPSGESLMRCCSIDLRALREQPAVQIPSVGTCVAVRYLPQAPEHALLPSLLPCLAGFQATRIVPSSV